MESAALLRADAISIPLRDNSVDLIITSPPYFALRSYTDGGEHYDGQIGSEPTPQAFLEALWAVTEECRRVLKPSGSMWVNLGDKYAGTGGGNGQSGLLGKQAQVSGVVDNRTMPRNNTKQTTGFVPAKSLMGLPWRYAIGCIDNLDLILRAEVVWCLSGGARVYAEVNGKPRPVMLRDLVRSYKPENVRLWNGEKWTQVLGWNRTADTDGALEFELRSGERIGCTPGHQWPTGRGLMRAEDVRVGDVIDTCTLPDQKRWAPAGLPAEDIGWLVGMYLAEGSRSGTTLQFAGHLDETERHHRLGLIADAYDGTCHVYQTSENGSTCNLRGSVLSGIIDRYITPGTAHTKRLTMHAWQRSDAFLAALVTGYLEGDGHYDAKNDRWRLGFTRNDELAADLRCLAARLGAKLSLRRSKSGWRGEWRWAATDHHNTKQSGEVVAIRASRARQFFDVGVADEPHLFALASGVLTHNSKPNGLPESVTDRVRRSHEQWFHFTKEPRYFAAVDEVREAHDSAPKTSHTSASTRRVGAGRNSPVAFQNDAPNPLGKLPGSVWTIPSEPLRVPDHLGVDHFAAFPQEWPRRIILGWSPSGICTACGEGRRPVVEKTPMVVKPSARRLVAQAEGNAQRTSTSGTMVQAPEATITGYACACDDTTAPTRPAVILDPFGGTGTVAMVARALGRFGVSMDLSADYLRLAQWRVFESRHWMKTVTRTHGQLNDKGEWKRPAKRDMVKGTMVHVDGSVARCWDCGWEAFIRSDAHGAALARSHAKVCT